MATVVGRDLFFSEQIQVLADTTVLGPHLAVSGGTPPPVLVPSRSLPYVEAACSVTSTIQSIWVIHILSRLQAADALKPQAQASKLADPPSPRLIHTLTGEREETTPRFETSPHTRYTHSGIPALRSHRREAFSGFAGEG